MIFDMPTSDTFVIEGTESEIRMLAAQVSDALRVGEASAVVVTEQGTVDVVVRAHG
jgi:hypothetical protein